MCDDVRRQSASSLTLYTELRVFFFFFFPNTSCIPLLSPIVYLFFFSPCCRQYWVRYHAFSFTGVLIRYRVHTLVDILFSFFFFFFFFFTLYIQRCQKTECPESIGRRKNSTWWCFFFPPPHSLSFSLHANSGVRTDHFTFFFSVSFRDTPCARQQSEKFSKALFLAFDILL